MDYPIVVAMPGQPPRRGQLTTEHPTSSYHIPVVLVRGVSYGSAEVLWVDGSAEARAEAARARYPVLSDHDSRWPTGYEAMDP